MFEAVRRAARMVNCAVILVECNLCSFLQLGRPIVPRLLNDGEGFTVGDFKI